MFGVIGALYTDHGGAGGVPSLTTQAQVQVRQKRQEVENVLNQSGTNTAPSTDVGGGLQRGSLSAGDWMELNGPLNLLNINALTFRVTGGTNGAASGTVELWRDAINAAGGGTLVSSQTITGTAAGTYASQTFPLDRSGRDAQAVPRVPEREHVQPQLGRVCRTRRRSISPADEAPRTARRP